MITSYNENSKFAYSFKVNGSLFKYFAWTLKYVRHATDHWPWVSVFGTLKNI